MNGTRLTSLSDDELLASMDAAASRTHESEAVLVAHIAEVDRRKLYRGQACPSMFAYCVLRLGLSEDVTYKRIQVARASRRFPQILARLAAPAGERIHLSGLRLLCSHLTEKNVEEVLSRAAGKTKREIEALVAELAPRPDVPATVRRLPGRRARRPATEPEVAGGAKKQPASQASVPRQTPAAIEPPAACLPPPASRPPRIEPLSPARFKVEFTADQKIHDDLQEARDLLSHRIPDGDVAAVIGWAMELAVKTLRKERFAETARPRRAGPPPGDGSRHIPNHVKRQVAERDGYRCTFVDAAGRRCPATGWLQFHHEDAHARGGPPTVENLSLRCRPHNQYQAELDFGAAFMERQRREHRSA